MKRVLCPLLAVMVLSGCDEADKSASPGQSKEIWPLKVGNEWIVEDQLLDTAGNVLQRDTTIILIAKDTMIQGQEWYIPTANGERDEMLPGQSRNDGIWGWDGNSAVLVWKYPAAVGDVFSIGSDTVMVESVDTTITVTAGTFMCVNYKWGADDEPGRIYQYHFLSPGVGYVCAEEYHRTIGGFEYVKDRSVLISYSLK